MSLHINLEDYISAFNSSTLANWKHWLPWDLVAQSHFIVSELIKELDSSEFVINENIAIHHSAHVETNTTLKGPLIIGANCFVAANAYIRGGCWLGNDCVVGPGSELKSSFVFASSKLAHFNFVGDSIIGQDVNLEAGSVICNYRNERLNKELFIRLNGELQAIGVEKFGALIGDHSRVGANAVLAPSTLLNKGTVINRAQLYDQELL